MQAKEDGSVDVTTAKKQKYWVHVRDDGAYISVRDYQGGFGLSQFATTSRHRVWIYIDGEPVTDAVVRSCDVSEPRRKGTIWRTIELHWMPVSVV